MIGMISRQTVAAFVKAVKKKGKKKKEKKDEANVNYRDYRGPMGVVEDAQKTKKK